MRDKRFADRIAYIGAGLVQNAGIEFDLTESDRNESSGTPGSWEEI
jgi:hypothetical protein